MTPEQEERLVRRLLRQARVHFSEVEPGRVIATVQMAQTCVVRFEDGAWSCPCREDECCHVEAVRRLTAGHVLRGRRGVPGGGAE